MATPAQILFKKIILHNKLMDAHSVDHLLSLVPEPEQAIQRMVRDKVLPIQRVNSLLTMYNGQLQKLKDEGHDVHLDLAQATQEAEEEAAVLEGKSQHAAGIHSSVLAAQVDEIAAIQPPKGLHPMLARLLGLGRQLGASDIHIRAGDVPQFRCAGRLIAIEGETRFAPEACERGLMSLLPVDRCEYFLIVGDYSLCYDGGKSFGRFRATLMRHHGLVQGTFRPVPLRTLSVGELKLPHEIEQLAALRSGLVLVTGPSVSGKTLTLAAMIDHINETCNRKIMCLDDPLEVVHLAKQSVILQREVGTHTNTFASGLEAGLRKALDVVTIDELNDIESIRLALCAAETGHLVVATTAAPNAVCALEWLIATFPPSEQPRIRMQLANVLRGVVAQQLLFGKDANTVEAAVDIFSDFQAMSDLIRRGEIAELKPTHPGGAGS